MKNASQVTKLLVATLVASALVVVIGCSADDGLGKRYAVSGTVSYKGEKVEKGVINFVPEKAGEGRGASGTIQDGSYSLTTLTAGDGALPGTYKVTVDTREIDAAQAKEATAKYLQKLKAPAGVNPQMIPQDLQSKMLAQTKSKIPGKYQIPETTDLKVTVEEKSNTINIELKD